LSVRPEIYDEIVARVNRKYEGSIRRGNQYEHAARIPTGSLELDVATGGGIPVGRWTRFYGGWHSTKTLRALMIAANAQAMGFTVAYYNVEKQYDPKFAKENIGLDVDEVSLVEGTSVEEIGEKMEAMFQVCHVHIVDSCSIAVSEDELNADVRDWRPGLSARAWGKVFRRLNERFDQTEHTVILIDHVTVDFRTGSEVAKGGKIFDHLSSMSIAFKKGTWLWRNDLGYLDEKAKQEKGSSGMVEPAGYEVKARVEKSRVCRPFRTAAMRLDLDSLRFDSVFEIMKAAKHYGVVRQAGAWYYYKPTPDADEIRFQGDRQLRQFVEGDLSFQDEVREAALAAARR
jgi:RecA/RadA recombinase